MPFIDLTLGTPLPRFFPSDQIAGAVKSLYENGSFDRILGYGAHINGDLALRERIIHLRPEYAGFGPDDILITFGSTDAIDLFFRNTLESGDVVVVENPTYKWAIKDILRCGASVVTVPVDADGMQVELFESMLRRDVFLAAKIKSVYTIPNFHNPTGACMSDDRRQLLVDLSKRYGFLILEDDPYYEFAYENGALRSLLDVDPDKQVVQICTFSKLMAPGIRLGWMATKNPLLPDICSRKHNASNPFLSSVVGKLLENDDYWSHLNRSMQYYRESLNIFTELVENRAGGFEYFAPNGGFYVLLNLPGGVKESDFIEQCALSGVKVMAGGGFFYDKTDTATIRLSFASVSHDDLSTACGVLNSVLKKISGVQNRGSNSYKPH